MKKTLVYGVATAAVLASIGGGIAATQCSRVETVYGPPPEISSSAAVSDSAESASSWAEIDDPVEDVYGPPLVEDENTASSSSNVDDDDEDSVAALYGPPPED